MSAFASLFPSFHCPVAVFLPFFLSFIPISYFFRLVFFKCLGNFYHYVSLYLSSFSLCHSFLGRLSSPFQYLFSYPFRCPTHCFPCMFSSLHFLPPYPVLYLYPFFHFLLHIIISPTSPFYVPSLYFSFRSHIRILCFLNLPHVFRFLLLAILISLLFFIPSDSS